MVDAVARQCEWFCDPQSPWQRGTKRNRQSPAAAILAKENRPFQLCAIRLGQGSAAPKSTPAKNHRFSKLLRADFEQVLRRPVDLARITGKCFWSDFSFPAGAALIRHVQT